MRSRKWAWGHGRGILSSRALETRDLAASRRRFVCGRGHGKSSTAVSSRSVDAPVAATVGTVAATVAAAAAVAVVPAIVAAAVAHSS